MADELPYMDNSTIDFSLLMSPSLTIAAEELQKMKSYLSSWGCFQLVNHGISLEYLDQVRNIIKEFFAFPSEVKQKYREKDENNEAKIKKNLEGYGTEMMAREGSSAVSRLFLTIYPEALRVPDLWPETPANLKDMLLEYSSKLKTIHDEVVKAMARSLNLGDNTILDAYGENSMVVARINYYPPSPLKDFIRKVSQHSDLSATTLLLKDKEVEALEVKKDQHWFKVPIIPYAIMVLAGDQLEILSNGIFKSPEHRLNPNPEKDRVSFAMFFAPDLEKKVEPLKELVTIDQPVLYKPMKRYIYLLEKYVVRAGERPISVAKI